MKLNHRSSHRKHFTVQQRAQLLKEFEHGQLTGLEFAAQHGIGASTLYSWLRRSRQSPHVSSAKAASINGAFQQVSLAEVLGASGHWAGEVRLPDGTQLRWTHQASTSVLQEVLTQLRQPC